MAEIARKTQVIDGLTPDRIPVVELLEAGQPAILKGLARDWPLVRSGLESSDERHRLPQAAFAVPRPSLFSSGAPTIAGRFFYNDEVTGFNFTGAEGAARPKRSIVCTRSSAIRMHRRSTSDPPTSISICRNCAAENDLRLNGSVVRAPPSDHEHLDRATARWPRRISTSTHNLGVLRGRPSPLYAVSAGAGAQSVSRAARSDAGRAGGQHGRLRRAGLRTIPAVSARRWPQGRSPSSSPATFCFIPRCGGTTSGAGIDNCRASCPGCLTARVACPGCLTTLRGKKSTS